MKVVPLFPTAVGCVKLRDLTSDELDAINLLGDEKRPNEGNQTSAQRMILHDPRLAKLKADILEQIHLYVREIVSPSTDIQVGVTQSWLNFTRKGEWHHKHAHPCSWLSACFYVNADPETDRIHFHKDGYRRIEFPPTQFNTFNSSSWWLPTGTGDLIIFPSDLTHHVAPVQRDDHTRISLAMNTWFSGRAGSPDSLTDLSVAIAAPFA